MCYSLYVSPLSPVYTIQPVVKRVWQPVECLYTIMHDIPLFADRRDRQMRQLFAGMHDSSHCLHRLLLENSVESAIHTLRNHKNYRVPFARTNRFENSFLLYALRNFQWVLLNICNLYSVMTFYWMYRPTCMSLSFYPAARLEDKYNLVDWLYHVNEVLAYV